MGAKLKLLPVVEGAACETNVAVHAWKAAGQGRSAIAGVQVLKKSPNKGVFRLLGAGPGGSDVCAKCGWREDLALERLVYDELLPTLGLPGLRCYGLLEDPNPKRWWLFIEDAGDLPYDRRDPEHVLALSDWLAMLHSAGERLKKDGLPRRGPAHYLQALSEGRAQIAASLTNPALDREEIAMLQELIRLQAEIESRWEAVERFCAGFAETLVHGDIKPKNLRMRRDGAVPPIHAFDWEMVGWGLPAADLERVDLNRYQHTRALCGSPIESERLEPLAETGRLFRTLASIEWASQWLGSQWISGALDDLRTYRDGLARSVLDGATPW